MNIAERLKGYKDVLADHSGIKIVDVFDTHGDSGTAMDKATEYLARKGAETVNAFVAWRPRLAMALAEALKRAGVRTNSSWLWMPTQIPLNLVKEGTISSTIAQKPYTMAFYGLKGLDDVHHYPPKEKPDHRLQFGIQFAFSLVCRYWRLAGGLNQRR